ncbi:MAG TPA: low specificity L-threonine aldolase [Acidimicrobiales bacterium]|nr:low specificity L-threonine aldolase [Acidimicrobiales bacterium]
MLPEPPVASFASDNASGAHPDVLAALVAANEGPALAYGDDPITARTRARLAEVFDAPVDTLFCWGGTGANVVGLQALLRPYEAVICADQAHLNVDECGALERIAGAKLIDLPAPNGTLDPADVERQLAVLGDVHHVQPKVVSITQATEQGTLYEVDHLRAIAEVAHRHGLYVHVDGARLANAVAALGVDVAELTTRAGVDVLSFGGAKNGLLYGEAVVLFRPELVDGARFLQKQAGQLPSKMRFISAQFEALLADDRWLRWAGHANAMAQRLADAVADLPGVDLPRRPAVNSVFPRLDPAHIAALQDWSFFWTWDEPVGEVRWMTSWATTPDDVDRFAAGVAVVTGA